MMSFKAGDTIIEEGDEGANAYVILLGKVRVFKHTGSGEITLAVLGSGQVFGEMALIEDRPRSASVRAETNLKLRIINRDQFNDLAIEEEKLYIIPRNHLSINYEGAGFGLLTGAVPLVPL